MCVYSISDADDAERLNNGLFAVTFTHKGNKTFTDNRVNYEKMHIIAYSYIKSRQMCAVGGWLVAWAAYFKETYL